jgi:hypothetical protein
MVRLTTTTLLWNVEQVIISIDSTMTPTRNLRSSAAEGLWHVNPSWITTRIGRAKLEMERSSVQK